MSGQLAVQLSRRFLEERGILRGLDARERRHARDVISLRREQDAEARPPLSRRSPERVLMLLSGPQSICLSMIVRDEAQVIRRCLDSVRPFIAHWAVVDTGSVDGTQEIIREPTLGAALY